MQPSDQAVDSLRTISAEEFAKSIRDHQIQDFSRCLIEGDVDLKTIRCQFIIIASLASSR